MKKNTQKQPMSLSKRLLLCILLIAAVSVTGYAVYYLVHFTSYVKYRDYLTGYEYEAASEYTPIRENNADVAGMELVAENDSLKLYTDTETGEIAVYDKRNKQTTRSNPENADNDSIANESNRNYLKSQFILNYYNKDIKPGTYDSYSMCVSRGQLTYEGIEGGIRYLYQVGDFSQGKTGNLPLYITAEKLDEIASKLPEKEATSLYRYYSIESETAHGMYELNGVVQKNVKTLSKLKGWFDDIGWTDEDYEEQMALAGIEDAMPVSFVIPLEYRLLDDGLKVSVPVSGIQEFGGGAIYRLQLLRYFGAADRNEDGYMVVPNGSGSIIYFNNGKTSAASYAQYVYDLDPLSANFTTTENTEPVKLPIYGICRENSSIMAEIGPAKTTSMITAGISGVYNDYNYVYPSFTLRTADNLQMFGDAITDVYVLEPDMYDADMTVTYSFLTDEYKGYAGIANYYRDKLTAQGILSADDSQGDIPFYYDIIGGVKETAHILGVQHLRTFSMTTFEEAKKISDDLAESKITNQVMNFQGWMNGGYYHDATDRVKVMSKLGGRKGLEELNAALKENGGKLYVDSALQRVSYADDDFSYNAEGSRYYGAGYVASFGLVHPTTLRATSGLGYTENRYNALSPRFLPRYVDGLAKGVGNLDVSGISLRDLGNYLISDKKRTNIITREQALDVVTAQWEALRSTGKELMADNANDYAFEYLSDIINAPTGHNEFYIVDEDIPLYEMIIHGSIAYSTKLLNYYDEEDMDGIILNMIEYGASPHYVFTWEKSSRMKNTALNRYYATTYETWKNEAVNVYERVNEALSPVKGAAMVNHEILNSAGNEVRKITYSNNITIYVNYGTKDVVIDGLHIAAGSYRLEGSR